MKRILVAMLGVGWLAVLAQVTLLREMLVVFYGNELCIGAIMACWLVCVGLGAFTARFLRRYGRFMDWTRHLLWMLPLVVAFALPCQVWVLRGVRLLLGVGVGEYIPFGLMLLTALGVCLPTCVSIGIFFPLACEWSIEDRRRVDKDIAGAVSRVYALEAMGSMVGGIVLTFVLLRYLTPFQIVIASCILGLAVGACAAVSRRMQCLLGVLSAFLLAGALACPDGVSRIESALVERRWRAFGVAPAASLTASSVRLVGSLDTVYQNLALTELDGQFALYGNGKILFEFPDVLGDEHRIHPMMGLYPDARRVLLLGGNPVGDIPQLLKYRVDELVFVELDPGIVALIRQADSESVERVLSNSRVTHVIADGARYAQQAEGLFDVILVNAPEPSTSGANRFYTVEFFQNLRARLAPDGIMITRVTASIHLQEEAGAAGGTVYQSMNAVFPVVKATAEAHPRLFAGGGSMLADGTPRITFDRQTLCDRSRSAGIETAYFRPEWFLGADELDARKTDTVERRFREAVVPQNRVLQPAAYFLNLRLWSRFSGSGLEQLLRATERIDVKRVSAWVIGLAAGMLLAGAALHRRGGEGAAWTRGSIVAVLALIGFFSMAMELLLVMVFQGLYGYVYTRMGLIVAAFMLGLVIGAPAGRTLCRRGVRWSWAVLFTILVGLLLIAVGIPPAMLLAYRLMGQPTMGTGLEVGFYLLVAAVGMLTGAAFPPANRIFADTGSSLGMSSAATDASDHLGAALGAILVGVVLLPVLGVGGTCRLLAALMLAGLLTLASARIACSTTRRG